MDLYVSGNRISNVTERAVNIRQLGGRAYIERNVITTGAITGNAGGVAPDGIHVFGSGSYLIAHNSIQSDWEKGAGIRVHASFADWPITGAIVVDNDVNMTAPETAVFGDDQRRDRSQGLRARECGAQQQDSRTRPGSSCRSDAKGRAFPETTCSSGMTSKAMQPSVADVLVETGCDRHRSHRTQMEDPGWGHRHRHRETGR